MIICFTIVYIGNSIIIMRCLKLVCWNGKRSPIMSQYRFLLHAAAILESQTFKECECEF